MRNGMSRLMMQPHTRGLVLNKPKDSMLPNECLIMDNLIPDVDGDVLRPGSDKVNISQYPNAIPDALASYISGDKKLLVFRDSVSGDIVAADKDTMSVIDTESNTNELGNLTFANFTNGAGGQLLYICGDAKTGAVYQFDGINFASSGFTMPDAILTNPCAYKNRIYFCGRNTTKIYYGDLQAISGNLNVFDISSFMQRGGSIAAAVNWRVNASIGIDNMLAIITTEGEVLIYRGSSPESDDWALTGVYSIPRPIGYNFYDTFASDVVLFLENGVFPLSRIIPNDGQTANALSDSINPIFSQSDTPIGDVRWMRSLELLIMNFENNTQYVLNVKTNAWCRFYGWNSGNVPFCEVVDKVFFSDPVQGLMVVTPHRYTDYTAISHTSPISYHKQGAYIKASDGTIEQPIRAMPYVESETQASIYKYISVDFKYSESGILANTVSDSDGAEWDISAWDEDFWANEGILEKYKGILNCLPSRFWSIGYFGQSNQKLKFNSHEITLRIGTGDS